MENDAKIFQPLISADVRKITTRWFVSGQDLSRFRCAGVIENLAVNSCSTKRSEAGLPIPSTPAIRGCRRLIHFSPARGVITEPARVSGGKG